MEVLDRDQEEVGEVEKVGVDGDDVAKQSNQQNKAISRRERERVPGQAERGEENHRLIPSPISREERGSATSKG
eukprot:scaffold1033_cov141-Skeletonema_marinoi.AAC.20